MRFLKILCEKMKKYGMVEMILRMILCMGVIIMMIYMRRWGEW